MKIQNEKSLVKQQNQKLNSIKRTDSNRLIPELVHVFFYFRKWLINTKVPTQKLNLISLRASKRPTSNQYKQGNSETIYKQKIMLVMVG